MRFLNCDVKAPAGIAALSALIHPNMQSAMQSSLINKPYLAGRSTRSTASVVPVNRARSALVVRAEKPQVVQPINGDPFIGMLETPVTSSPLVSGFLSRLPAYKTGVSPLLRGNEVGLAHGLLLTGPFIKLGPLRNSPELAERVGVVSAAGLVVILTLCLAIYGAVTFENEQPKIGVKTLSGRDIERDPLQSNEGWQNFTAGWFVGGLSGVFFGYILTKVLPYYS